MTAAATTVDALLQRYDFFLLDAYGVLVSGSGALPGAAAFLHRLREAGKSYLIVSNDASRAPGTSQARYSGMGLPIDEDRILTSGLLIADHYARAGLIGAETIVLGTDDSCAYVRKAGGVVVAPDDDRARVVVVGDDDGYPFLETVNETISVLLRRMSRGEPTALVLPNPDLIFPMRPGAFGITAGAIAALIELVLRVRHPEGAGRFVPLGKPHAPMFEAAARRLGDPDRRRMVMVGDQLATDILGANRFGIDSVLVETGVGRVADLAASEGQPTFTMSGLG
ncbi:MAG TPA: HAD-IIA family hydrolase [Polyangia bacterium]|jgi:HAD superfamily hydrolase (TIGR01459 family)